MFKLAFEKFPRFCGNFSINGSADQGKDGGAGRVFPQQGGQQQGEQQVDKVLEMCIRDREKPVMISEDFSWYQRHLPALFFFLGCGPSPALVQLERSPSMYPSVTSDKAILQASRTLLQEQGWTALNIRSVAAACGVSVGSIYNRFGSKSQLVAATVESCLLYTSVVAGVPARVLKDKDGKTAEKTALIDALRAL